MQLALIPPFSRLSDTKLTQYQLMLPECLRNQEYAATYYHHTNDDGTYLILDNGAAEGDLWEPEGILAVANEFQVDEIVIPDVIGNRIKTAEKCVEWYDKFFDSKFKHMLVAQGQTVEECVDLIGMVDGFDIDTIGIPRHLAKTTGERDARLHLAHALWDLYGDRFDYHFLGATPLWAEELHFVKIGAPWVRGMDTSMPYNYAHARETVDSGFSILRPDPYFDIEFDEDQQEYLKHNIDLMLGWVADGLI